MTILFLLCFAVGDQDFKPVAALLVFNTSSKVRDSRCVEIAVLDDDDVESNETFTVELMPVLMNDVVNGSKSLDVIIQDTDGKIDIC